MLRTNQNTWYHANRYSAESACEHCDGIIRHERWCITTNPRVLYAYEVILTPSKLEVQDQLILHALGVKWACTCGDLAPQPLLPPPRS